MSTYPYYRARRLRRTEHLRRLVSESSLNHDDLILPIFVCDANSHLAGPIDSMPGINRYALGSKNFFKLIDSCVENKISTIAIFPVISSELKTPDGSAALDENNLIIQTTQSIKNFSAKLTIIADIALDPFTTHGQDGIFNEKGYIDNDKTIEILCKQAIQYAQAGVDILAPSDMMDGRISEIRKVLEKKCFFNTIIMAYAAKYASAFYGPFRDAVGSKQSLGNANKKTYQMDPANVKEALREVSMDIEEGADLIMIKPGMPYLDIISLVSKTYNYPIFAYQVSGEYAMIKAASQHGWINHDDAVMESLLGFKRAGAIGIFSYFAIEAAKLLAKH